MRLEMLEMAGEVGFKWTGRLLNVCMQEGRIPKEWRMDLIVPIWKRKGDVHDPGKYRDLDVGSIDLEKASDTVPREMVMATLRWMGVPEAEARMVEGTYERTTARVVVGEGASEEFEVKIGLRQGSVLSALLFIAVLYLISRKTVVKYAMKKLLYADHLAPVANCKQELQETMEEWNGLFTKHGLKLNLQKTEVLHIGHQWEELDIELEGKKLTQREVSCT